MKRRCTRTAVDSGPTDWGRELDAIDPDLRQRMISETAYRYCSERGYADGYDVDDWLQAEADVDHVPLNPHDRTGARTRE